MDTDHMRRGFTIVELMVCIVLVVILAAAIGPSAVKLLRVHESLREEGFMREKLAMLAGIYADWLSLADSIVVTTNKVGVMNKETIVKISAHYPEETEGISFETNIISKVSACHSVVSNGMWNIWFETKDPKFPDGVRKISFDGDALIEHVAARIVDVSLEHVDARIIEANKKTHDIGYPKLSILATNHFWDVKKNAYSLRTVKAERIVRLWNGAK